MFFGVLAFSVAQSETAKTVKAEKPSCYQPCSKVANSNNYTPFYYVLTAAASEEMSSSPEKKEMSAKEKAACKRICAKTVAANGKCDPKDCPPECLPPNCKIVPCKAKSTAIAINQSRVIKNNYPISPLKEPAFVGSLKFYATKPFCVKHRGKNHFFPAQKRNDSFSKD